MRLRNLAYVLLLVSAAATATLTVPNAFQDGSPARASQVNENFAALMSAVNTMEARIQELEAEVASLKGNSVLALDGHLSLETDSEGREVARFDEVNVQITNGLGATNGDPSAAPEVRGFGNGLGNLIVGYNEESELGQIICANPEYNTNPILCRTFSVEGKNLRSGSHNVVIGVGHSYTTHGALIAGLANAVSDSWGSVPGGLSNVASGMYSSVSGGTGNKASGEISNISGGTSNEASGDRSSVSGGRLNDASGYGSSVSGGEQNDASGIYSSVSGGAFRSASDTRNWVAGSLFEIQ